MAAITGRQAKLKITAASGTASTGQALSEASPTTNIYTYRIDTAARRHWDRGASVTLYRNTTAVDATDYTINYAVGEVSFGQAQSTGETMTADITWLAASYLADARAWTLDVETDMLDITTFTTTTGNTEWREFATGLSGAAATLERITVSDSTGATFFDRVSAGQDLVVEFIVADTNKYEGYAHIEGDEHETVVDALSEETVTLRIDGPLSYTTL